MIPLVVLKPSAAPKLHGDEHVIAVVFVVNPIAGMGGSVGLRGTDGEAYWEALRRGARPVSPGVARRFVEALVKGCGDVLRERVEFLTAGGGMGEDYLREAGLRYRIVHIPPSRTSARDTVETVRRGVEQGASLVIFVGGDGTARDVGLAVGRTTPILGIPAGVKMFSGVFAISPEAGAAIVCSYLRGEVGVVEAELMDIDEEAYRRDVLSARLYGYVKTVSSENLLAPSKSPTIGEEEAKDAIARYFVEELMEPDTLYLLGPGSTVATIARALGYEKTLLGFDAVYRGRVIARDLWGDRLVELLRRRPKRRLVLTPIGSQGFLIGRGNKQLTPEALTLFSKKDLIVVATPNKIMRLRHLLVDTGSPELDRRFSCYHRVVTGYREERIVKIVPASIPDLVEGGGCS
ncbi:MAG: ATP-NAD kinase [Thermoprotei archaeon]|nr:MAG: ATP-NAD kinase [Thermoprotei archaeon]